MDGSEDDGAAPTGDASLREQIARLESLQRGLAARPRLALMSDPWLWLLRTAGVAGCLFGVADLLDNFQPRVAVGVGLAIGGALLLVAAEIRAALRRPPS